MVHGLITQLAIDMEWIVFPGKADEEDTLLISGRRCMTRVAAPVKTSITNRSLED